MGVVGFAIETAVAGTALIAYQLHERKTGNAALRSQPPFRSDFAPRRKRFQVR